MVLAALALSAVVATHAWSIDWNTLKPTFWLEQELSRGSDATRQAAGVQLLARAQAGTLSPDQIDRVLDVNQIPNFVPGPPVTQVRPIVPFRQADFWAQGINFGLEWKY